MADFTTLSIPVKPIRLHRGELGVLFSAEEVWDIVEPFKLALVGKFSFDHPLMDVIRKFSVSFGLKGYFQVSLINNRHVLIKLEMKEDYSKI